MLTISFADCADALYMMAVTSGRKHAGSNDRPIISVTLNSGEIGEEILPNIPVANEMTHNKADLWNIPIDDHFGFCNSCIKKSSIRDVKLRARGQGKGKDGWNIESIMTFLHINGDCHG